MAAIFLPPFTVLRIKRLCPVIGYKFYFDKDKVPHEGKEKIEVIPANKTTKKKTQESGKPNRFHNYQQRDTDYDKLVAEHDPLMEEAIKKLKKESGQE